LEIVIVPRLHKNTFECVVLPFWINTELETVVVNTLEYVIQDGDYPRRQGQTLFYIHIYSSTKRVIKKKGVDLSYAVISRKGRYEGTNVYACIEGDPLPIVEELLNKRYKAGWSIKEDRPNCKMFYDHSL
jgi:hypothetical protein